MNTSRALRRTATAAVVSVAALLTACSAPSSPGTATSGGGVLNAYLYQAPKQFSPLEPANGPDQIVMALIFDSMLTVDASNNTLVPSLATALPTVTDGGRTFTYHLRSGIKWSDGKPFTSKDVLFTYNLLANPKSGSAAPATFAGVSGFSAVQSGQASTLSGLTAPDASTFVIHSDVPNSGLTALIGRNPILPEHVLGKVPLASMAKNSFFDKPTVALGPYKFVTYKPDQYVQLTANPEYRQKVHISTIYLKPVTADVATAQLGTGEMDLVQISPTDLPTVSKLKNVAVAPEASPSYVQITTNIDKPYFKDPRVRQAMLYGVNRQQLVSKALAGQGTVQNSSFVVPQVVQKADLNDYAYDPAKAKALLEAANWPSNQQVTLEWIPGQRDRDTAATVVASQLSAIGMKVKLKQVQSGQVGDDLTNRTFDMLLFGGGNRPPDEYTVYPVTACDQFFPKAGANLPHYCNKQMDSLMNQTKSMTNESQRDALFAQAAHLENQDPSYLWLYSGKTVWAYNKRISGYKPSENFTNPFPDIANWSLSK